jgi:hypothetical protein
MVAEKALGFSPDRRAGIPELLADKAQHRGLGVNQGEELVE